MDLYIPFAWTPYEGESHYGVFSTRDRAEQVLKEEKEKNYYENYDIFYIQLDTHEEF